MKIVYKSISGRVDTDLRIADGVHAALDVSTYDYPDHIDQLCAEVERLKEMLAGLIEQLALTKTVPASYVQQIVAHRYEVEDEG